MYLQRLSMIPSTFLHNISYITLFVIKIKCILKSILYSFDKIMLYFDNSAFFIQQYDNALTNL